MSMISIHLYVLKIINLLIIIQKEIDILILIIIYYLHLCLLHTYF